MQTPVYKPELVIEQIPEIYDKLIMKNKGKWKQIAFEQAKTVLDPNEKEMRNQAKKYFGFSIFFSFIILFFFINISDGLKHIIWMF
jgi:hypothetical protein